MTETMASGFMRTERRPGSEREGVRQHTSKVVKFAVDAVRLIGYMLSGFFQTWM